MIRVLSIVRELAMIMLKRICLFFNGIFKIWHSGRIIDKTHMYDAVSRRHRMMDLYGYCISIWYDKIDAMCQAILFQEHNPR